MIKESLLPSSVKSLLSVVKKQHQAPTVSVDAFFFSLNMEDFSVKVMV